MSRTYNEMLKEVSQYVPSSHFQKTTCPQSCPGDLGLGVICRGYHAQQLCREVSPTLPPSITLFPIRHFKVYLIFGTYLVGWVVRLLSGVLLHDLQLEARYSFNPKYFNVSQ